jgi:hypothetical protein
MIGASRFIERIFRDMGYKGKDAHIRARVTYYHQVGYYAMGVRESRTQRMELIPYYRRVLTASGDLRFRKA